MLTSYDTRYALHDIRFSPVKNAIIVRGARVHNLKNIDVEIPKGKLVVITGLSGSGKSSLAFDTIYAEGQRRYMESLSSFARRFLEIQDKPDVDEIEGLSPTIAIDQRSSSTNPRSTVGTVTEIYDYLRLLFARIGTPHCPKCGRKVVPQSVEQITEHILLEMKKSDLLLFAPMVVDQKGEHRHFMLAAEEAGYKEVRFDGLLMDLSEVIAMRKDKNKRHTLEVLTLRISKNEEIATFSLAEKIKQTLELGNGMLTVFREADGSEALLSKSLSCPNCHLNLPELEPRVFSFNSPHGACPECTGLGLKLTIDEELVIPNPKLTLAEGALKPWSRIAGNAASHLKLLEIVGAKNGFTVNQPIADFTKTAKAVLMGGTGETVYEIDGKPVTFVGIAAELSEKHRTTDSEYVRSEIETYMREEICPSCNGKRLRPEVLGVKVCEKNISEVCAMSLDELNDWSDGLCGPKCALSKTALTIAGNISKEVKARIGYVLEVGLNYLTLDRSATTLSGGESQRLRLATQLGSALSGVIYVLDEPSIGLHPRDHDKLITTLQKLRALENTVIVVEHDAQMMNEADYLIDVGPGAGEYGGKIIAQGTPAEVKRDKNSLTGQYLSGKLKIEAPAKYRKTTKKAIMIKGATAFNLKNVDVQIPLGVFTCVTGVSGSGKSTLILDILGASLSRHFYRAKTQPAAHKTITGIDNLDKVVSVDQSPIGRTPRSNPATYTGVFTAIRDIFTETPEAKMRSFDAGKFSFNVKGGGRCEACSGEGMKVIEMQFMPDVYVECEECHGKRYNHEALEVRYKGKTIADVLEMTVDEARRFWSDKPLIYDKLGILYDVGLGYLHLGQSATTLSGGEAQRVKLATELSRRDTGRTLYILDEPTTGLHFEDIKRLLLVLQRLVDKGNSVLVIEHNMDVVKCADWVIDMGPDGGAKGGNVVACGTPKDIVKIKGSITAKYLKEVL